MDFQKHGFYIESMHKISNIGVGTSLLGLGDLCFLVHGFRFQDEGTYPWFPMATPLNLLVL